MNSSARAHLYKSGTLVRLFYLQMRSLSPLDARSLELRVLYASSKLEDSARRNEGRRRVLRFRGKARRGEATAPLAAATAAFKRPSSVGPSSFQVHNACLGRQRRLGCCKLGSAAAAKAVESAVASVMGILGALYEL